MGVAEPDDLSILLEEVRAGREDARERLVNAIYSELRRIATGLMRGQRPDHTLQASALVHEAVIRLLNGDTLADVPNRRYLFTAAAQAMRQVLVDHARRRQAAKRDGGRVRVPLEAILVAFDEQGLDIIALHESLDNLAQSNPRQAEVVTLRFFAGLTVPEVAEALGVSDTTVESDWRFARAWLRRRLGEMVQ
jgi:RNA polymerase sigma factor (TIGR02999 family)